MPSPEQSPLPRADRQTMLLQLLTEIGARGGVIDTTLRPAHQPSSDLLVILATMLDGGLRSDATPHSLVSILTWGHPECATPEILALAERVITLRDPPRVAAESEVETGVVSVFEQPTQYFLHPFQRAAGGPWRAASPSLALPLDAPDSRIGESVLYLLTECRQDVMTLVDRPRDETLALLKPARVRSWMTLQRKARLVHVTARSNGVRVEPTRNGGNRGDDKGFHSLVEQAEILERAPDPAALGAAVRRAFRASTPPAPA
jgi:hypothetical protein